ncbi:indoleamine 2,3-dioxygenase [Exophiala aquamarina CBS 119918]|uniref:Indoleamine 2,3-dioxygenase n=1 Tax=Exophiala aquamarina CBS 119918 TaxID=1182545 RepID=A0A072P066_9EURO|nr:indoleamine 2,3-dioxygenase [Exophiala aquamarina CBS 119918]KEF52653.1 indoleamine 2,3-dioxygenase [Exophiala aquamarina CBS 119918]
MKERPQDILCRFGISARNGFLPDEIPLRRLSHQHYAPWESLAKNLSELIVNNEIRAKIDALPILETIYLRSEAEWQRAYSLLAFWAHAYFWGGQQPSERLPPQITCPLLQVSSRLGLPPTATYSALNLWNWERKAPNCEITDPENLRSLQTATGTRDEEWFYLISVSVEAKGGPLILAMLQATQAVRDCNDRLLESCLQTITQGITELGVLLNRMREHCDPQIFYHVIRPLLAGSKGMASAGLPRGVFYDEGNGKGQWREYSGGSNAQSSLIQLFDIVLGVDHHATGGSSSKAARTGSFIQEMRNYMPRGHREFLAYMTKKSNIREYASNASTSPTIRNAYNKAVEALVAFRNIHIQIVAGYIIAPSRAPGASYIVQNRTLNLATASTRGQETSTNEKQQLAGTGGTMLIPFLKRTRDETGEAAVAIS